MCVLNNVISTVQKHDCFWKVSFCGNVIDLEKTKNDLSHAFSTETFGFLVETKAMAYHSATLYFTIDFTGSFFTPTCMFFIVFIVWLLSRGQRRGKTSWK